MTPTGFDRSPFGSPRALWGIGVMLLGIVLFVDRLGLAEAGFIVRFWPVLLIAYGVQQLSSTDVRTGTRVFKVNGAIWVALGGILLLRSVGIIKANLSDLFWPSLLILIGVRLVLGRSAGVGGDIEGGADGALVAVLSGVKRVSAAVPFRGTEVTALLGGVQIDLRRAQLEPGQEAVIDLLAVMGGCEIFVPSEWVVSSPVVAILGGVEDKRVLVPQTVIEAATARTTEPPRLVLRGFVLMGGVTLR